MLQVDFTDIKLYILHKYTRGWAVSMYIPDVDNVLLLPCCFQKITTGGKPGLRIFPFFLAASAAS